jgi:uncharacterized protein (DUF433 family)
MPARPQLDIYKGSKPFDHPVYPIAEAARYLRLPATTVRSWALGRPYLTHSGMRTFAPVVAVADAKANLLSFRNLVELHILSSLRRVHQVELRAVRRAIRFLRERLGSDHPLLDEQMLTDGKDLFIERYGELVNISQSGQLEMKRSLEVYLRRIERDKHGIPVRLYPFTRGRIEQAPRVISIDPRIRFGKPCIAGTRIPTAIIAERHEAGDSLAQLAEDYGRPPEEIEEALRYESRAAS